MSILHRGFNPQLWRSGLIIVLAGVLLTITTACGNAQAITPDRAMDNPGAKTTAIEDPNGLYHFKDTERDTTAADAKAKRMIREAKQRTNQFNSPADWVDSVTPDCPLEAAGNAAENIGESTQRAVKSAADKVQNSVDHLR
ncbi:MAG: hypothetical protein HC929_18175 [Leptolyngbyaceae cyanobacterium SM2_5_2]|nr:hypothetical protein [Leptolyngbyaceae cyanobacterium SM2_5_2]